VTAKGTNRRALCARLAALGLLASLALSEALWENRAPDFFIYRAGAERGLRGASPYDRAELRALVAAQYPDDGLLHNECGYFLPPHAVLVYAPFAAVPLQVAKVLWALVNCASLTAVFFVLRAHLPHPLPTGGQLLLPLVLACNCLTVLVIDLGQTSLMFVGCVAAGLLCFERKQAALGVLLWSVAFVKPHLALALIPLAWYPGGWKRAAALIAVVAVLNLTGATLIGGSPLFFGDYLSALSEGHKGVMFNRAERNPEITSWNRLLYALTEPVAGKRFLLELTALKTIAGYVVWFALVAVRCWIARAQPSPAWALAACAVGALLCSQVLPYDVILLVLAIPWVRELFAGGRWFCGWLAAALLVLQLVPFDAVLALDLPCHRPIGVALFALMVLIGPPRGVIGH
jgi:hypothetical protein